MPSAGPRVIPTGVSGCIHGAILVGGQSRRMGRPKSLIEVGGVTMVRRIASALTECGCTTVVAIGPVDLADGLDHVADLHPGEGPLGGILTALASAAGAAVLVLACDLPSIDAPSLTKLIDASRRGADVVAARVSTPSGRLEPLCALWQPVAAASLGAAFEGGERAVHRAMAGLTVIEVSLDDRVLTNVNAPDDLPSE